MHDMSESESNAENCINILPYFECMPSPTSQMNSQLNYYDDRLGQTLPPDPGPKWIIFYKNL